MRAVDSPRTNIQQTLRDLVLKRNHEFCSCCGDKLTYRCTECCCKYTIFFDDNSRSKWSRILFSSSIQEHDRCFDADHLVCVETNPGPGQLVLYKAPNQNSSSKNQVVVVKKKAAKGKKRSQNNSNSRSSGKSSSSASSSYLRSVLAPCTGPARIPDISCIASDTIQLVADLTYSTNAAGYAGGYINLLPNPQYLVEGSTTTDATFAFGAVNSFPQAAIITSSALLCRVVSACIDISYIGSTMNNQGQLVFSSVLGFTQNETAFFSLDTMQNGRSNWTTPLKNGGSSFYRPFDNSCLEYKQPGSTNTVGILQFHVTGAQPSTAIANVRFTVNLEFIRKFDSGTGEVRSHSPSVDLNGLGNAVSFANTVPPYAPASIASKANSAFAMAKDTLASVFGVARELYGAGKFISQFV